MEIVPNKIRGGMITLQFVWYVIYSPYVPPPDTFAAIVSDAERGGADLHRSQFGGIIISLMMQQLNEKHPDDYLIAMRVLWAPIGAMIFFWIIVPESPWFLARKGDKEGAMKSLKRLYGNIAAYDYEEEYGIIEHTIQHETALLDNQPRYRDLFKGVNKVRFRVLHVLASMFDDP